MKDIFTHNIINDELFNLLTYDNNIKYISNKHIYLVKLCILENTHIDSVIVYHYVKYLDIFSNSLLFFLASKPWFKSSNIFNEFGDYIVVLDQNLGDIDVIKKIMSTPNKWNTHFISWLKEHSKKKNFKLNDRDVIKKMVFTKSLEEMAELLILGFQNENTEFFLKLVNNKDFYPDIAQYNILKSCLWVTSDLNSLKRLCLTKNVILNEGIKKNRGQLNSLSSFLALLDNDYRNFLYNSFLDLEEDILNLNIKTPRFVKKKKFNFNNIHNKLGGSIY